MHVKISLRCMSKSRQRRFRALISISSLTRCICGVRRGFDFSQATDRPSFSKSWSSFHNRMISRSSRRPEGIFIGQFEQGEIGPDLFRLRVRLEGLEARLALLAHHI